MGTGSLGARIRPVVVLLDVLVVLGVGLVVLYHVAPRYRCERPQALLIGGKPTGFEECASGLLVRREPLECPSLLPRPEKRMSSMERQRLRWERKLDGIEGLSEQDRKAVLGRWEGRDECYSDNDCTKRPHGQCVEPLPSGHLMCIYGCVRDSECAPDKICKCGGLVGRCVKASCKASDECAWGQSCALYSPHPGCWLEDGFACQSERDGCASNKDCPQGKECGWEDGRRVCMIGGCRY